MFFSIIVFHSSEYTLALAVYGSDVTLKSPLISTSYLVVMIFSLLECFIEIVLFLRLKELWWVCNLGHAMDIVGKIIRKAA